MNRGRLVTLIAIGITLLLLALGAWLYPMVFRYIQKQDCIAAGYTSCVQ